MEEGLPLRVGKDRPGTLPAQIAEQVRALVESGALRAGDALPSTRSLADNLRVSRGTVVFAYEQLVGEGYLESNRGGTRVARGLELPARTGQDAAKTGPLAGGGQPPGPPATGSRPSGPPAINLLPSNPDTSLLANRLWRSAWRQAVANPGATYPPAGSPALRFQLAEHLRLTRSVLRTPDDLLVTAGARDGFRLVLTALRQRVRHRPLRIAVENPGYPSLHRIPQAFGHQILPIPVDEDGFNPAHLPTGSARPDLVLVAPSHQYPLGASMPAPRRLELINWARAEGAFIVEDDYDSELRYTGSPLPALAALDRPAGRGQPGGGGDRVITLGSFAKVLAPGLNLGFIVVPRQLRGELLELRADLGNPVSAVLQQALADFLASGGVRHHTARMRRVYRRRRQLVLDQLAGVAGIEILPMDGGLHAVLRLLEGAGLEGELAEAAAEAGVLLEPLAAYWSAPATPAALDEPPVRPVRGLVLGFGGVSDRRLEQGLSLLRGVLAA